MPDVVVFFACCRVLVRSGFRWFPSLPFPSMFSAACLRLLALYFVLSWWFSLVFLCCTVGHHKKGAAK